MSTVNRVTAMQCAVNACARVQADADAGRKIRKDDLDLIRYALRSGFIKALIDNMLPEAEKAEFDSAMRGQALVFFADEDKSNVY
jgi:hypothetical protein